MAGNYDIVVMGGGQNTLGAAAYLAKAGKKVVVLERNDVIGSGAVTVERNVSGFKYDKHSVAHALIQANPLILNDELGLISQFGLRYFYPPTAAATVLEDYRTLPFHRDLDKTCESIAQYSTKDAETYRKFVNWGMRIMPMILAGMFNVPLPMSAFLGLLEQSEDGRRVIDLMLRSPLQIVNELFESDIVKIHLLKFAGEGFPQFPDDMGTGLALLLSPPFIHKYGVGLPVGGSGDLSKALGRCIEHHGGAVITNCEVTKVLAKGGRAIGLVTTSGEQYLAKDAVIAAIHPHHLDRFVDGLEPNLLARAKRTLAGPYSILKIDAALDRPLSLKASGGVEAQPNAIAEFVFANTLTEFLESYDPLRHGRLSLDRPLISGGAIAPLGRVPEGKALLYLLCFQPYDLADGGPEKWDQIKERTADAVIDRLGHFMPDLTPERILGRTVDSPLDMVRWSPNSMLHGDASGIGAQFFHLGGYRPTPELAQFAVPGVDRLYLCGPFMHPGGGVFGVGRPTAIKICDDLGIQFEKVVAR
jgi:phytoene dehydrogenase-like protein